MVVGVTFPDGYSVAPAVLPGMYPPPEDDAPLLIDVLPPSPPGDGIAGTALAVEKAGAFAAGGVIPSGGVMVVDGVGGVVTFDTPLEAADPGIAATAGESDGNVGNVNPPEPSELAGGGVV